MITLFTLYNIIENKLHYVEDFNGFYLGHDDTKVMFGYIYPVKWKILKHYLTIKTIDLSIPEFEEVSFQNATFCLTDNILFRIPSLEDIQFIKEYSGYTEIIYLSCWLKNYKTRKLFIYTSAGGWENLYDDVSEKTASMLLIRYVDILK